MKNPGLKTDDFISRISRILPAHQAGRWDAYFDLSRPAVFRINTLRTSREYIDNLLMLNKLSYNQYNGNPDVLIIPEAASIENEYFQDMLNLGLLYQQGLSSILVPFILDPRPGERVLDLCAAPGSKATQMAALMQNEGELVCVEAIRKRIYKLKAVVELLGVKIARFCLTDGRRYRDAERFDRILVDAPCSSEGRVDWRDLSTLAYWSPRKIQEMVRKQRGLVLNAFRLLKPGGVMVYSTCTFAPEENEGVINWLLKKAAGAMEVVPVHFPEIPSYPAVESWNNKSYNPQVKNCLRILPDQWREGFFITKLIKS